MKKILLMAVLALLCGASKYSHATADGTPSTGSFTVVNVSSLSAHAATGSLTVVDTITLVGTRVNIGAFTLTAGIDWQPGVSTVTAAINLTAAINASGAPVTASFHAGNSVITLTAIDSGSLYNSLGLSSSDAGEVTVSGAHLTGGQDNASVSINAVKLLQGRDWFVQDVASNTAVNLAAAINHNPLLNNLVGAVWTGVGAKVFLRATLSPVAYTLASSAPSDLTVSGATMTGGSSGNLSTTLCFLGSVNSLPTANYPAGCLAYKISNPATLWLSTEPVVGSQSWAQATQWTTY